ncbi:MAG TPA: hypothetical protein VM347_08425 [Nonomuraea sp.]|nr:hypothetical protein [Nonomuraea sp.]
MSKRNAVAGLAVAAALLVAAAPASASAASAARHPLKLRNGLTLSLPSSWKVYGKGDWLHVVTGKCAKPKGAYFTSECDGFWVLGPAAVKVGHELNPYTPDQPFYSATDVEPCPVDHKWGQVLHGAAAKGLRQVGPGHKAYYRAWKGTCVTGTGKVRARFVQREWYLPKTGVLVVDSWNTPGLLGVLKHAAWR